MLMPYFEQSAGYALFNFNCDTNGTTVTPSCPASTNLAARQQSLPMMQCPSEAMQAKFTASQCPNGCGSSNYQPSLGNNANWNIISAGNQRGPFARNTGAKFRDFIDGMSNTAMFGEIRLGPATTASTGSIAPTDPNFYAAMTQLAFATWDAGTPGDTTRWPGTLPGDVERVAACDTPGTNDILYHGKQYYRGIPVPSFYSHTLTPNSRLRDCARAVGVDRLHAAVRSFHTGGAHIVLGDGGVRFAGNSVDSLTWRRVGAMADGQVVGEY